MIAKNTLLATIVVTVIFLVDSIQLHNYWYAAAYVLLGTVLTTKLEEIG